MKIFIFSRPYQYHVKIEAILLNALIDFTYIFHADQLVKFEKYDSIEKIIIDLDAINDIEQLNYLIDLFSSKEVLLFQNSNRFAEVNHKVFSEAEILLNLENYVQEIQQKNSDRRKDYLLIKVSNKYKKILKSDINYIRAEGKYSELYVADRRYVMRISMKSLIELLPPNFIRIHASYIVNTECIENINTVDNELELTTEIKLPFSRKYKSEILSRFTII